MEEPDAERNGQRGQIHKPQDREVQQQVDGRGVGNEGKGPSPKDGHLRQAGIKVAGNVEGDQTEGNGKADPEDPGLKRRRQRRSRSLLGQHQGHLGQGKGQPLALHPMPAQHHHRAQADEVYGQHQQQPPQQWRSPRPPRNGQVLARQTLIEKAHGVVRWIWNGPIRQIGMDVFGPLVGGGARRNRAWR